MERYHPYLQPRIIFLCLYFMVTVHLSRSADCSEKRTVCDAACVSTERVLHRYGVSASASVLMAKPVLSNSYILCYARPVAGRRKSQIYCLYGKMDDLSSVQQQFVTLADGMVTRFEAFALYPRQYVVVFAVNRSPALYEVDVHEKTYVSLNLIGVLGGQGAQDVAVTNTATGVTLAISSGRHCQQGDLLCGSPSVTTVDRKDNNIRQCSTIRSGPAEFVSTFHHSGTTFFVFGNLMAESPYMYKMSLLRLSVLPTGECGLMLVQHLSFGRPVCGVRDLEMINMVDESHVLLVASRPCPVSPEENPYAEPQSVNVIRLTWDPVSQKFPVKELKELPDSTKVAKMTQLSEQFFICQKESEPSSIHVPLVTPESSFVGTVRLNNQASISSVQSANGDAYFTHVTSSGAVVIDWISCLVNQNIRPSNFSLSRFSGNPFFGDLATVDFNSTDMEDNSLNSIKPAVVISSALPSLNRLDRSALARQNTVPLIASSKSAPETNTSSIPSPSSNTTSTNISQSVYLRYDETLVDLDDGYQHKVTPDFIEAAPPSFETRTPLKIVPGPIQRGPPEPRLMSDSHGAQQNGFHGPPMFAPPHSVNDHMRAPQIMYSQNLMPVSYMAQPPGYGHSPQFHGQFGNGFGGPNQIPEGVTLAGYFAFPPVAIFAAPNTYPEMHRPPRPNGEPSNTGYNIHMGSTQNAPNYGPIVMNPPQMAGPPPQPELNSSPMWFPPPQQQYRPTQISQQYRHDSRLLTVQNVPQAPRLHSVLPSAGLRPSSVLVAQPAEVEENDHDTTTDAELDTTSVATWPIEPDDVSETLTTQAPEELLVNTTESISASFENVNSSTTVAAVPSSSTIETATIVESTSQVSL